MKWLAPEPAPVGGGIDGAEQPCMSCSRAGIDQSSGQHRTALG